MKDLNNIELNNGDIIDIHQTVNGQNLFVVMETLPLDIRYFHDKTRHYEYDKESLLASDKYTGESTFEIVGNMSVEIIQI